MRNSGSSFGLLYILLVAIQLVIFNYINLSPLVTISLLPAIVFCIPLSRGTVSAMIIAFITGIATDFLGDGLLGLNAFALVPVAFMRKALVKSVLGKELVIRQDDFSIKKCGFSKIFSALFFVTITYLTIYILADGAGLRPLWFNLTRFALSTAASLVVGLIALHILTKENKR